LNFEGTILKLLLFAALDLAAAGEDEYSVKGLALARTRELSVIENAIVNRPRKDSLAAGL
jgi:hypothetical protein